MRIYVHPESFKDLARKEFCGGNIYVMKVDESPNITDPNPDFIWVEGVINE